MNAETQLAHRVLVAIRQILLRVSSHSKAMSQQVGLTVPQLLCKGGGQAGSCGRGHRGADSEEVELTPATVSRIVDGS